LIKGEIIAAVHSHHNQRRSESSLRRLKLAAGLTFIYMLAEGIGGWLTNSLALIADAGHMLTDVIALGLTLTAAWFAERPATARKTYGYYRLEILAAFANGIFLVLLSLVVIYEAVQRWYAAPRILAGSFTLIAIGGLAVNLIAAYLLNSSHKHDLSIRGAWLHVIGDLLGSIAAILAGLAIIAFNWLWADALSSIVISLIIVYGSWRLIMESVNVLLEGTPRHIDLKAVETVILNTKGVSGVHDLHVWTISSGIDALSAHISHHDEVPHSELLNAVRQELHDRFGIDHLTIQVETLDHETEALYVCEMGTRCFEPADRAEIGKGHARGK
jgi:cobalt-zinc-cadmium efflux system protein